MSELRRIMCVEDDPDIRMLLEFSLTTVAGYEVCLCPDGYTALAQAQSFKPDFVMLDVMMPDFAGPETLAALRNLDGLKDTPAVFMTAKGLTGDNPALLQSGALGVITKPFNLNTLHTEIRRFWEQGRVRSAD